MEIRESISKLFNLSKNGELKLLIFDTEILEQTLQSFMEGKNPDKFTYIDFGIFIDKCVLRMEEEGFKVRWASYYQATETEGISSNSPLVLDVKKPKSNHQYTGPQNIKTYTEVPNLTPVQKMIVKKYQLTQHGTIRLLPFEDVGLMYAMKQYDEKYGKEEYFYMTYFLWFADDFCRDARLAPVIQRYELLRGNLKLTNRDPFSYKSDPKEIEFEAQEDTSSSMKELKDQIVNKNVKSFNIGGCKVVFNAKHLKANGSQEELKTSLLKEQHKKEQDDRKENGEKLKSLFEEDDMDYGSAPENDNLPF